MACTMGIALGATTTSAKADTTNSATVSQATAIGEATATVVWTNQTGNDVLTKTSATYAYGYFFADYTGYTMNAWLERSTDGGQTWSTVSGVHAMSSHDWVSTYSYYDGPGYLARACFQFTSWSGAAVHCTAGI